MNPHNSGAAAKAPSAPRHWPLALLAAAWMLVPVAAVGERLASGGDSSCIVTGNGQVRCWGPIQPELSFTVFKDFSIPRRVELAPLAPGPTVATGGVAVSDHQVCATITQGVTCVKGDEFGTIVPGLAGALAVAVGEGHACAITATGRMKCWGMNNHGQLGDGTTVDKPDPVDVVGLTGVIAVALGDRHSCALLATGNIKCWGAWGTYYGYDDLLPVTAFASGGGMSIAVSGSRTCAAFEDDSVRCLGSDGPGGQGDPPAIIVDGIGSLAVGSGHACATGRGGLVYCWGDNARGQLGDGTFNASDTPVEVLGIRNAVAVSAGQTHSCARLADGDVQCWGDNQRGQLGSGKSVSQSTQQTVNGIADASFLAVGDSSCAIVSGGLIKCWGGSTSREPVTIAGISGATSMIMGNVPCALIPGTGVKCWTFGSQPPVIVPGSESAVVLSRGSESYGWLQANCTIDTSSAVKCWEVLPTVTGALTFRTMPDPQMVGAVQVASGPNTRCAIDVAQALWCWGSFFIDSAQITSNVAVRLYDEATRTLAVGVGERYLCTINTDAVLRCSGLNYEWQLGIAGAPAGVYVPTPVTGVSNFVEVAAGRYHTCAIQAGGAVWCWGARTLPNGQIGNRSSEGSMVPARVTGLTGATDVAVGSQHSCALRGDGTISCWGLATLNRLGNGELGFEPVPQRVVGSPFPAVYQPLPTGLTGIWYEPASSGQGVTFQVLGDDRLLVLFNGFTEGGESLTLTGEFRHTAGSVFGVMQGLSVYETRGRGFTNFSPASIQRLSWGSAFLVILDCSRAELRLQPSGDPGQTLRLVQLSRPAGLSCTP